MKEYQHNNVTIRIHEANIDPIQRRKYLEEATIKLMKEVVKNEVIPPSSGSTRTN